MKVVKAAWKVTAAIILIGSGVWVGSFLNQEAEGAGLTYQPGSADDPVVTKSYVDQQIQQALKGNGSSSSSTSAQTPANSSSGNNSGLGANASSNTSSTDVQIVDVKPGKKLIAEAGAEFIVRAGKAVVYSEDQNGVADLTDGKDITNGGQVLNNHLLSFPRAGRGIQVKDGETHPLTVMVRGGYSIQ